MDYRGYRFEEDGRYHPADLLYGEDAMYEYLTTHMLSYAAVKILDNDEFIVAEAASGHIIFPKILAVTQICEEVRKQKCFDSADLMWRLSMAGINLNIDPPKNKEQAEQLLELLYIHHSSSYK